MASLYYWPIKVSGAPPPFLGNVVAELVAAEVSKQLERCFLGVCVVEPDNHRTRLPSRAASPSSASSRNGRRLSQALTLGSSRFSRPTTGSRCPNPSPLCACCRGARALRARQTQTLPCQKCCYRRQKTCTLPLRRPCTLRATPPHAPLRSLPSLPLTAPPTSISATSRLWSTRVAHSRPLPPLAKYLSSPHSTF